VHCIKHLSEHIQLLADNLAMHFQLFDSWYELARQNNYWTKFTSYLSICGSNV